MRRVLLLCLVGTLLSACAMMPAGPDSTPRHARSAVPTASAGPLPAQVVHGTDPYLGLAAMLHARGVRVWWETDLVARWLQGPAAFRTAVDRLAQLARAPGTAGFKVADELGYGDGLQTPDQALSFLRDAHDALARVAPGKPLLIDAVVPDLGCLPWRGDRAAACAADARSSYPAADVDAIGSYLRSGLVDDLDLSTGLLDPSYYDGLGLTFQQAQRDAWAHVETWGWARQTTLRARKALADAGGYQGSAADAAGDVGVYVDTPTGHGAASVDIWTWRQTYQGRTVSLLDAELHTNPLWQRLADRHATGVALFTHMTPSQLPSAPRAYAHECDLAASVFTDVFVAAGTG